MRGPSTGESPPYSCPLVHRYQAVNALVPVPLDKPAIMTARERFLKLESVFTLEQFLCGWFFGAPFSSIKRGNVEELIAYGFYTTRLQELSEEVRAAVRLAPCRLKTAQYFTASVTLVWDVSIVFSR